MKGIKTILTTALIVTSIYVTMGCALFIASYSINRGWNTAQQISDKEAVERVIELLGLE